MHREVEDVNPYEDLSPNQVPEPAPQVARHEWCGRVLTVEANAMPSCAYQGTQYFVIVDGDERFTNTKWTLIEHFEWQFEHEGRMVTGRFAAKGLNNGIARHYRLWIDGELLAESKVKIKDGWKGLAIGVGIGFAVWIAIIVGVICMKSVG